MKLLTIDTDNGNHPGVIVGDGEVLDLALAPDTVFEDEWRPSSVREILHLPVLRLLLQFPIHG